MADYANLSGLKETIDALKALPSQFASNRGGPIRRALFAAAKPMREDAERRAPIRTGNLRANVYLYRDRNPKASTGATERFLIGVRTKRHGARTKLNLALGRIGKNFRIKGDAFYWRFVEFGTSHQPAQGFMRKAFEAGKAKFVELFASEFAKGVEAAAKRAKSGIK